MTTKIVYICFGLITMFLFSSCVSKQTANYDNRTKHILGLDCERNPRKCTDIGLSYERGVGVPSNIYIAIDLYTRSCEAGYARACSYLSDKYVSDELRLKYNCIIKNHHKDIEKAKIDEESKDKLKQLFADPKKRSNDKKRTNKKRHRSFIQNSDTRNTDKSCRYSRDGYK